LVDAKMKLKVSSDMIHTWTGWSIFEGFEFTGWPIAVVSNGRVIASRPKGEKRVEVFVKPGSGRFLKRAPLAKEEARSITT
jgi:dihydropyrimidinase